MLFFLKKKICIYILDRRPERRDDSVAQFNLNECADGRAEQADTIGSEPTRNEQLWIIQSQSQSAIDCGESG